MRNLTKRAFEIEPLEGRVMLAARLLADLYSDVYSSYPSEAVTIGDEVFFSTFGTDEAPNGGIYVTDGTTAGTRLLKEANTTFSLTAFNGALYFVAASGAPSASELWRSDGTAIGTIKVFSDNDFRSLDAVIPTATRLFVSEDGIGDYQYGQDGPGKLWVTDGTSKGTKLVKGFGVGDTIVGGTAIGERVVFELDTADDGGELWASDGTALGTKFLASDPDTWAMVGSKLLFITRGGKGTDLWSTDGTPSGNKKVIHLSDDASDEPIQMQAVNGKAVFNFDDGAQGNELWVTDGTEAGTMILKDATPGSGGSTPASFMPSVDGGTAFFLAQSGASGTSLWRTDGTPEGTTFLSVLSKTRGFMVVSEWASRGNWVYFGTEIGSGTERGSLWASDGTPQGTMQYQQLDTESADDGMAVLGSNLIFSADSTGSGEELWILDVTGGSISGSIFADSNMNGSKDSDEDGLAGWKVFVDLNGDGVCNKKEPQVRTSSTGFYEIDDLAPGKYTIRQTRVEGYAATTSQSYRVTVTALGNVVKKFGDTPGGTIQGRVFNDLNANRVQDSGEAGLFNFRVWIDLDNDGTLDDNEPTAHTNSAGRFVIADLLPGSYRIRLKPRSGWMSTTAKSFSFALSARGSSSKRFGLVAI